LRIGEENGGGGWVWTEDLPKSVRSDQIWTGPYNKSHNWKYVMIGVTGLVTTEIWHVWNVEHQVAVSLFFSDICLHRTVHDWHDISNLIISKKKILKKWILKSVTVLVLLKSVNAPVLCLSIMQIWIPFSVWFQRLIKVICLDKYNIDLICEK